MASPAKSDGRWALVLLPGGFPSPKPDITPPLMPQNGEVGFTIYLGGFDLAPPYGMIIQRPDGTSIAVSDELIYPAGKAFVAQAVLPGRDVISYVSQPGVFDANGIYKISLRGSADYAILTVPGTVQPPLPPPPAPPPTPPGVFVVGQSDVGGPDVLGT